MPRIFLPLLLMTIACFSSAHAIRAAGGSLVYFGTDTEKTSEGIYAARFDAATGTFGPVSLAAKTTNPLFIAQLPNKHILYAIGERKNTAGKVLGTVEAFTVDIASGQLTPLNHQTAGEGPLCYLSIDKAGHTVLGAAYNDGYVVAFPLRTDGKVGERTSFSQHTGSSVNQERQTGPHAHCIDLDPANQFALVADLGLDQVLIYKFDPAKSTLTPQAAPFATKPGAGPRHLAFDHSGRHVYLVNELDSTLTLADYDAEHGRLTERQTLPLLPPDFKALNTAAEVVVHPSGKFLYASNRGFDSLALFAIAPDTGRLTFVEYMREGVSHPRHFVIDPSGNWLLCANRDADTVTVYRIDPANGHLTANNNAAHVPMPTCIQFLAHLD
jgi:6-phosphogluconolactonase